MPDRDIIHRWLTQSELDDMIERARIDSAKKALTAARKVAWNHGQNQVLDIALSAIAIEDIQ